jgi:precorrin-4/cobalt-precorrin-4 C11-methyltransferase
MIQQTSCQVSTVPAGQYPAAVYPPGVYIVGAGPGDLDLITVKGQQLLQQADVVLVADSLVPQQMLQPVRSQVEIIRTANKTLEEIAPIMIERVRSGQVVVRLHDGDPCFYGALQEQINLLLAADIPFEIVPGISAYQLAAARLRVELTVPEIVQSIILTRISGRTHVPAAQELASLAAHQASLALYLSARHVQEAQTQLMQHYPPDTPVAICFRLGWPDEQIWLVPLEQMAAVSQRENLIRTTMYLISPALAAATVPEHYGYPERQTHTAMARSRLYHQSHSHLFRPEPKDHPRPSDGQGSSSTRTQG